MKGKMDIIICEKNKICKEDFEYFKKELFQQLMIWEIQVQTCFKLNLTTLRHYRAIFHTTWVEKVRAPCSPKYTTGHLVVFEIYTLKV